MPHTLTHSQARALSVSRHSKPIPGLVPESVTASGLARAGWRRMMEGLAARGLVVPYVHGVYEMTPAGVEALDGALPETGSD